MVFYDLSSFVMNLIYHLLCLYCLTRLFMATSLNTELIEVNDSLILNHADLRAFSVHNVIKLRLDILKRIAKPSTGTMKCNETVAFLKITEYPYGQAGNHIISLTHTLWLATKLNATLVVPKWIQVTILQFDVTLLNHYHCFTFDENVSPSAKIYEITSEEANKWTKVVKSANIKVD